MNKILVFAGKKQSGKSTAANFVTGYTITQLARGGTPYLPCNFEIDDEDGTLNVNPPPWGIDNVQTAYANGVILDLNNQNHDYLTWASDCMWPHVKTYAFADMLKSVAVNVFGIPEEFVNGTDEDKKQLTNIKWKDIGAFLSPKTIGDLKKSEKYTKKMNVREFLQYFGTNVCRKIYDPCWVESCYRRIDMYKSDLSVIQDCRFRNEVMASKKRGAKIVKLERAPIKDLHVSEVDLDKMSNSNFDLVIPPDVTIREKNNMILEAMYSWGWFENHLDLGDK